MPPPAVITESKLSEKMATGIEKMDKLGEKSLYACADCGGSLWKIENGKLAHYRCHVGHSYSEDDLVTRQAETAENSLWVAVRMMEERRALLASIARKHNERGLTALQQKYETSSLISKSISAN